jgi:sensor domain CHASE-containing protein
MPNKIIKLLVAVALGFLLYFVSFDIFYFFTLPRIERLEETVIETRINIIKAGFRQRIKQVESITRDWSYWDDLYNFMGDLNQDFADRELVEETLLSNGINLVLFYNTDGYVIYKKTANPNPGTEVTVPAQFLVKNETDSLRKTIADVSLISKGTSGLLHTNNGNIVYSIYPILKSSGDGPSRGALLMGRFINDEDTEVIKYGVDLDFMLGDYYNLPLDIGTHVDPNKTTFVRDTGQITAYEVIKDSFDNPAVYIKYTCQRFIFSTWSDLVKAMAMISMLIGVGVYFLAVPIEKRLPTKTR